MVAEQLKAKTKLKITVHGLRRSFITIGVGAKVIDIGTARQAA